MLDFWLQFSFKPHRAGMGGGATAGKLTYKTVPWVGMLNVHGAPIIWIQRKSYSKGWYYLSGGRESDFGFPKNVKFPGGSPPPQPGA